MFNEGNQIHNFMSSSGSGTVINYDSGSGSDFLTSYGSSYGSGSTSQKFTVPTVPVPVPQHCEHIPYKISNLLLQLYTALQNITLFSYFLSFGAILDFLDLDSLHGPNSIRIQNTASKKKKLKSAASTFSEMRQRPEIHSLQ
jgi:hypothetical protein